MAQVKITLSEEEVHRAIERYCVSQYLYYDVTVNSVNVYNDSGDIIKTNGAVVRLEVTEEDDD